MNPTTSRWNAIRWIDCVAVAATAASLVARQLGPTSEYLVILTVFVPYFAASCLMLAVAGATIRHRAATTLLAAVGLVSLLVSIPSVSPPAPIQGAQKSVDVMSLNARLGRADPAQVVALASRYQIDVLALQEITPSFVRSLMDAGISDSLPFSAIAMQPRAFGTALWSATPLSDVEEVPGMTYTPVRASTIIDNAPITLLSFHTASPTRNANAPRWAYDLAEADTYLSALAGEVIVAGDFNATPDHAQFRELVDTNLVRANERSIAQLSATFPSGKPYPAFATIDHVLVSRDLRASVREVLPIRGSDHYAVVATVGY
ncbi:endonuclease/exonuclease/phosphatase family protein [Actinomycetes bacterium M1A6_2h]